MFTLNHPLVRGILRSWQNPIHGVEIASFWSQASAGTCARHGSTIVIVNVICPSGPTPVGGVIALYEFANGLSRRGHEIHLVHLPLWGQEIRDFDVLDRYDFEPEIVQYLPGVTVDLIGPADILMGTGADPRFGLPVHLVQGVQMLNSDVERQAFRTPCLKVAVASWLVDVGQHFGVDADQFEVVPMGIDLERFRGATRQEDRRYDVGLLANSHPAKGWALAMAALDRVRTTMPDLRAVAFGIEAPEDLPPWLTFVENPGPDELVADVYDQSRVFLQASTYEGFGFTAIEAMACGAALVTTDNGGSRDYAFDGRTALVAQGRDRDQLASLVVRLLDDAHLRRDLALAGQRYVQGFDWDTGARILEHHLDRYLADPERYQRPPGEPRPLSEIPPPPNIDLAPPLGFPDLPDLLRS